MSWVPGFSSAAPGLADRSLRRLRDDGLTCSFIDSTLYRPSKLWIDFNERRDFLPNEGPCWCKLFVLTRGLGPRIKDFFHSRFAPE